MAGQLFSRYAGTVLLCMLLLYYPQSGAAAGEKAEAKAGGPAVSAHSDGGKKMAEPERLSREEGDLLLSVARNTIENRLSGGEPEHALEQDLPEIFKQRRGTFVTLTKKGSLRGCIGHIIPQGSLISGIRENAVNAAFRDPRFPPLGRDEWADIHVEISILTEPAELAYRDADDLLKKLRPNVDGVIIKKGFHQATFLPQVWEQLPEKIHFLRHLCLKAGLERDEWKSGSLQVSTYQVQAFEE